MNISGRHLDAGNNIKVTVGGKGNCEIQGNRTSSSVSCETSLADCKNNGRRRRRALDQLVCVKFDGSNRKCAHHQFTYQIDPLITAVYTNKEKIHPATFFAGGQVIHVEGQRLNLIQDPKIIFYGRARNGQSFMSSCELENGGIKMQCLAPNITTSHTVTNRSSAVLIGFKMANVMNLRKVRGRLKILSLFGPLLVHD